MGRDYEKLGAFYLGREVDSESNERTERDVLYDARDLTTHAVIIGMTGSGKTGLGIGLLEEALMDNIPVIAVDPKGDLPNLMLTFPDLKPDDFRPWINEQEATNEGLSPDEFAAAQAKLWRTGLAKWGQDGARIRRLRENVSFAVYTPGSNAARPVNVMRSFAPPPLAMGEDADLWRDAVQSTTTGLLTLVGMAGDPLTSREHILVANILDHAWGAGTAMDLPELIRAIQSPPFDRLGVMGLESFFPQADRFALAMRLNNLLASPGFSAWLDGDPLDISRLLYADGGRPRASILSIAHLSEAERMFFVSMLLNRIVAWVRKQPGTGSLRAILYMDEVFGYFPPVANPPSKRPLLTLLKQARAQGLGVVLSTQNPVDLDYKGLANAGTWFLGRLQTERDKARVLEGLESAGGGGLQRDRIDRLLSSLGKRRFLLHNVHESEPVLFETRWVMSYLRGPMTRDQLRKLEPAADRGAGERLPAQPVAADDSPPVVPPGISVWYLGHSGVGDVQYVPKLLAVCDVQYRSRKHDLDCSRRLVLTAAFGDGANPVDWDHAELLDIDVADLRESPTGSASFAPLPAPASDPDRYGDWKKAVGATIRQRHPMKILRHDTSDLTSTMDESEAEFRARVAAALRELRDREVAGLRRKYDGRLRTLEGRLQRASQAVERERSQARSQKIDTVVSIGTAVLGALLGRKRVSVTSASRVGTAVRKAGRMSRESQQVEHAEERVETIQAEIRQLEEELTTEIERLEAAHDPASIELQEVAVRATSRSIEVELLGLLWLPYRREVTRQAPDWKR